MQDDAREPVARGSRVMLVPFRSDDLDAVHAFASDPEVCRFTTWGPNSLEDTAAFLASVVGPHEGRLDLAVIEEGEVVGSAAVWTTSAADRAGELGYTLRRDHWGRGLGSEVARLLVDLGLGRLGLERVTATCHPANAASIRVLEKAGLQREGLLRGHLLVRGHRRDSLLLALLATDGVATDGLAADPPPPDAADLVDAPDLPEDPA